MFVQTWAEDVIISKQRGEMTHLVDFPLNSKRYVPANGTLFRDKICIE